jgi:hypothetical protein
MDIPENVPKIAIRVPIWFVAKMLKKIIIIRYHPSNVAFCNAWWDLVGL